MVNKLEMLETTNIPIAIVLIAQNKTGIKVVLFGCLILCGHVTSLSKQDSVFAGHLSLAKLVFCAGIEYK